MARGFESKQVESQQAEAERRRELKRDADEAGEDRARQARRRSLELAHADVKRRLAAATAAPLREMLGRSLAALEAELAGLGDGRPPSQ